VKTSLGLAVAAVLLLTGEAEAQRAQGSVFDQIFSGPIQAGPRFGRDFKNKAWLLGGQIVAPVGESFQLRPSGDLLFPRGEKMGWQLNGDVAVQYQGVFGGGGIAFVHPHDGDTETGYNLFLGVSTAEPQDRSKGFLEFRWTVLDEARPFRLVLGFLFQL
jgi:hypothetical protein